MKTILIIEDDFPIRQGLVDSLEHEGYSLLESGEGEEGLEMALTCQYDLLLLDLALPGRDGMEILQEVRQTRPTLPIIILTARGAESQKVTGLKKGADDYIVKPFGLEELLARVEAVLRRSPERPLSQETIEIPGGVIDFNRSEIRFENGHWNELSEHEVTLLQYLTSNAGRAISRDELLLRVWGMDPKHIETRTIDMHIARLRKKLGEDTENPTLILTVRGKGYKFSIKTGNIL